MDNHVYGGGPQQQPNGILPRPPSHSRRPQPSPPQQHQMEPADLLDDEDNEFGGDRRGGGDLSLEPQRPAPPPASRSSRGHGDREVSRSNSREKESSKISGIAPKFLKIAVIGDSTVGKTCLCHAVTLESYTFNKNYNLTCGVNVYPKAVKVPDQATGDPETSVERLNMALLDSSGKDVYLDYLPKYWDKLDGFILVVDLTNPASLTNAEDWVKLALSSCPKGSSEVLGILIGNKMDLSERRKISPTTAQEFAAKHNLQYFECSVKENSGLEDPLFFLAHKYTTTIGLSSNTDDKENVDRGK